ncbi:DUF2914 domain-containing protein [Psychromonas aquatilis]|uniref:DUF2914 domain-containing protein n=1 Tax=Psychromonas aquatilis TaxID=2005072 RepID=A0ABU9GLV6_9GAMM
MKDSKNMTVRVSFNQQTTAPLKNNGVLTEKPRRQYYWGRIALLIAAILIILITIIISFKHYFGEDEQPKSQPVVKDLTITSNEINSSEAKNTNSLNTNTTTARTNSSNQASTTPIVEATQTTAQATVQTKDTAEVTPRSNGLFSQPNTTIFSDNIKRFSLAPYINGKEPAGDFSSLTFKKNITTIWAFSEAINLRNETLYYVWKLNGKQLAKVRVGVGADRWRSNSSKLVQKNMQGNWLVELQDSQGKVLANSKFTY